MINFTPHTPPLEPPLGNQFTLGLEKKKADSSSTQPPLSESAKKWVPKISTDGPLKGLIPGGGRLVTPKYDKES